MTYKRTKADDEMSEWLKNITPEKQEELRLFSLRVQVKDMCPEYSDKMSDAEVQTLADQLIKSA